MHTLRRVLSLALWLLTCLAAVPGHAQFVRVGGASGGGSAPVAPLPATFIWYGDSIVQGAGSGTAPPAKLQSLLPGYVGFNAGISNETAAQIATRYFAAVNGAARTDCNGEQCGTYLFEGGVNDCKGGVCTPSAVLATMLTMVDDCRARGRRCIWSNIMPFRDCAFCGDTAAGWVKAKEYNALWRQACASRSRLECLDVGEDSDFEEPDTDGFLAEDYSFDGIHLQQAGTDAYAAMAAAVF